MKIFYKLLLVSMMLACQPSRYELAFASDRLGKTDICVTKVDSEEIRNLTRSDVTEYNFTWSADGTKVYYTSYESNGRKINCINTETSEVTILLQDSTVQSLGDVSDDGLLLITTKTDHPKGELYTYDTESNSLQRITHNELYEAGAKFSPDHSSIVAGIQVQAGDSINPSGVAEIFVIEREGLILKQLTDLKGFNALPDYAPDGSKIAFHHCDSGICDIFVMNADGTAQVNLTQGQDDNRWPRWSPDGRWIAFTKTIDGNSDIYFISPDGKEIKPVIVSEFRDEVAEFKP